MTHGVNIAMEPPLYLEDVPELPDHPHPDPDPYGPHVSYIFGNLEQNPVHWW